MCLSGAVCMCLDSVCYVYILWVQVDGLFLQVLNSSGDPSLCRKSAILLSCILKNCTDGDSFGELLEETAKSVIVVIFTRLQWEVIHATAEKLAETLMFFARRSPKETR